MDVRRASGIYFYEKCVFLVDFFQLYPEMSTTSTIILEQEN